MSQLYALVSVVNRRQLKRFRNLYEENGASLGVVMLGRGTAVSEVLDYFGLAAAEKAIACSIVTEETWTQIKTGLQRKLYIDVPGTGVAFVVPLSSVGGKKQLQFLLNGQDFTLGEETSLKDTKYELLVAIADQGGTEQIMDAARAVGAGGGTVLHAKGTGMEAAEHFLGFSLAAEKEIVLIVVPAAKKKEIMGAVMEQAGLHTGAKTVVFSLPVTDTAGMRLTEEEAV